MKLKLVIRTSGKISISPTQHGHHVVHATWKSISSRTFINGRLPFWFLIRKFRISSSFFGAPQHHSSFRFLWWKLFPLVTDSTKRIFLPIFSLYELPIYLLKLFLLYDIFSFVYVVDIWSKSRNESRFYPLYLCSVTESNYTVNAAAGEVTFISTIWKRFDNGIALVNLVSYRCE